MDYKFIPEENYHSEVKLGKRRFRCYSPKQMAKMYPNDDFRLVGETLTNNSKSKISQLSADGESFNISNSGSHGRFAFKRSGYIAVEGGAYVAVLTNRIPFLIILFSLLVGLAASGVILIRSLTAPDAKPYNPVPEIDPMVEPLENDNGESVQSEEGGGFVSMVYTLKASLDLPSGEIEMLFRNPKKSNHHVVVELYIVSGDAETMIAKSGLIAPGYGLSQLAFIEDSAVLRAGTYNGKYIVHYYDAATGERALVDSEINDLAITVTE